MLEPVSYTEIGTIQRKHGLQGHVVLLLNSPSYVLSNGLKYLFIQIDHTLVPYCITHFLCRAGKLVMKLRGIDDPKIAHSLKGRAVFVHPAELRKSVVSESSIPQLIGYRVEDTHYGHLGIVSEVYSPSQQQLLAIDFQGKELLVPCHEDIVVHIDHQRCTIGLQLPHGFIEAMQLAQ